MNRPEQVADARGQKLWETPSLVPEWVDYLKATYIGPSTVELLYRNKYRGEEHFGRVVYIKVTGNFMNVEGHELFPNAKESEFMKLLEAAEKRTSAQLGMRGSFLCVVEKKK